MTAAISKQPKPVVDVAALARRFTERKSAVGVIGMGYVGLPLAKAMADRGFKVLGLDRAADRVAALNRGESYIHHIPADSIADMVKAKGFSVTADFARLSEVDAMLICVPTPLTRYREPDLSFIEDTGRMIAQHLRRGQLVVLESTTYPGTTTGVLRPLLEAGGLKSGRDFFLAYSPEREDPGNVQFGTASIPKVVGGDGPDALMLASALYGQFVARTVPVSAPETAEAVKLTENIFRAVNIALANELKVVYGAMGIDVWEVIEAAKTKPFGFMPFYPGPGLGGHCIPIDPFYLTWKAREFEVATRFIELAGEINTSMPHFVVERLAHEMDRQFKRGLNGSRVLIVGLAYKKNVDDIRESPSFKLIELIEARGGKADYYDPYIPMIPTTREHAALANRRSVAWSAKTLSGYDAVLIATDHDNVDYKFLAANARLVVDTRNACGRAGLKGPNIVKA